MLFSDNSHLINGAKFVIIAKDFKFDIMVFLDTDKRLCQRVKSLKYD